MKIRTLVQHTANQKPMAPGDEYEADERSAELAVTLGWGERVINNRAVVQSQPRTKRQYRRRDMTAQP